MQHRLCISNMRPQLEPVAEILTVNLLERERQLTVDLGDHAVLLLQDVREFRAKCIDVEQICHTYADTRMFVHIGRDNTTLSAVNLILSSCLFLKSIQ